ncbi:hypothetical protein JXA84_09785 [candidate division WOR-3 bacterium]|nr:hypothetical protein [candidate division WOR-3 bacterium]
MLLLEKWADVNAKNKVENTPLMLTVDKGFIEIAELLFRKGADVKAENQKKGTLLLNWRR